MKILKSLWFKCIVSLSLIILISGASIAILSDVLHVSSEERTSRALKKIYGDNLPSYSTFLDVEDKSRNDAIITNQYGEISKIFIVDKTSDADNDYDMVFMSTGYHGYKDGQITMWIQVRFTSDNKTIAKTVITGNTKQTLMSLLDNSFTNFFTKDGNNNLKNYFTSDKNASEGNKNVVTGATKSANAGCNAVNCVIEYLKGAN